jgi:hypothetical protein
VDWADYLRDEAAKYRQLAKAAEDPSIKQELLDLAAVVRRQPITLRIVRRAASLAVREVRLGQGHLPVRDRRAYNIALEPTEGSAVLTQLERQNPCASHEF